MSRLDCLRDNRPLLITSEIIGWLHMLGKVHPDFLRGQCSDIIEKKKPEYNYEEFYKQDDQLKELADDKAFQNILMSSKPFNSQAPKLASFFNKHRKKDGSGLLYLLQEAHGIVSGVEKNLPKDTSANLGQTSADMWLTSAYGYELQNLLKDPSGSYSSQGRQELYNKVAQLLKTIISSHVSMNIQSWFQLRQQTIGEDGWLKKALLSSLAETRWPNNDVTVWDQSYVAAALMKSVVAMGLLTGELPSKSGPKIKWRIFGAGLNAQRLAERGIKISDILGAKEVVEIFLGEVQKLLEVEIPLGALLYRDANGAYFSFPNVDDSEMEKELKENIEKIAFGLDLEISPITKISEPTRSLIPMGQLIWEMRGKASIPVHGIEINSTASKGNVCPVCLVRLNGNRNNKDQVCQICEDRRSGRISQWKNGLHSSNETIWIEEVADQNGRVALLTASFDLRYWLNGRNSDSLRSQSIWEWIHKNTATNEIQKLLDKGNPNLAIRERIQHCVKRASPWDQVKQDCIIRQIHDGFKWEASFDSFFESIVEDRSVQDMPYWGDLTEDGRTDWLLHQLFKKNASPARIRRFWETTQTFFDQSLDEIKNLTAFEGLRTTRLILTLKKNDLDKSKVYDGTLNGASISICHINGQWITISNLQRLARENEDAKTLAQRLSEDEGVLKIRSEDDREWREVPLSATLPTEGNIPIIPITRTPDRFWILVPTEQAMEITHGIKKKYEAEMSKVRDRLPLHVGLTFFPRKTPLFAVMEAGRRMTKVFESQEQERWQVLAADDASNGNRVRHITLGRPDGRKVCWHISYGFADPNKTDYFYPYFKTEGKALEERAHTFAVPGKERHRRVHVSELEAGDTVTIHPSRFSFIFLDTTARRFEAGESARYLEDVDALSNLWSILRNHELTDTALRNGWAMIKKALADWGDGKTWRQLVETTLKVQWKFNGVQLEKMKQAVFDGLLKDCLELHLKILKKRLGGTGDEQK